MLDQAQNGYEITPPPKANSGGYEIAPPPQKFKADQPGMQPKPGYTDTVNRELKSGYESIKGLVPESLGGGGALYHAGADPMTDEEKSDKVKYLRGGEPVGPVGRGLYRAAVAPVARASEYWYDKAKGNIPSEDGILPDAETLAVAPEAIGGGAGAVVGGEAVPKVIGAAKNVPRLAAAGAKMLPATSDLLAKTAAIGKVAARHVITKAVPGADLFIRKPILADYVSAAMTKGAPFKYGAPAGPAMESGAFSPIEGEYLPSAPPKSLGPGKAIPLAEAREVKAWENPPAAPYRKGPGAIPVDETVAPDPFVLGGRRGVRVQPPRAIRALPEAPPEAQPFGVSRSRAVPKDVADDADWQAIMREDLETHGARANREMSQRFREGNDVAVPKWKMQAEAKADLARQGILKNAELANDNPMRGIGIPKVKTKGVISTPDEDLLPALKKSIEAAKAKKKS